MHSQVWLHTPIEVTGDDVEKALVEQCSDEAAIARVFEQLRGVAAEGAAEALNRALDIDVMDVLAQGWAQVPAVHTAVQLSALTQAPQTLVDLDRHSIVSTARVVLETRVAQRALPPLQLTLEISADVQSATLAAREGRIDLVALGQVAILAQLRYEDILVKEHVTGASRAPRDPFERRPPEFHRPPSVDFPL